VGMGRPRPVRGAVQEAANGAAAAA
jgi:hypothetical protein